MTLSENILFYAFRYALGRMSYVTQEVSDEIIKQWDNIPLGVQKIIQQEVRQAIDNGEAGMKCDVDSWKRILKLKVSHDG